ncbi:MAG: zinc ribbon domain-containing protein [Bryobacteraceae bacterium]|nr:zinc ribbon domain-containing protein [Bryobacteraceae bacterium]
MPIYEYRCPKCGSTFEKLRRISESSEPTDCPKCGAKTSDLMYSSFATGGGCGPGGGGRGGFT